MANVSRDDVEALLHGAELLDSGVEGDADWSDAMMRRFGDQILGERLTAVHSMARELRLHAPADRSQVAVAMLEHRGVSGALLDTHPSAARTVAKAETLEGTSFIEELAGYVEAEPVGRRRDSPTDWDEPAADNLTTKQRAAEGAREERDVNNDLYTTRSGGGTLSSLLGLAFFVAGIGIMSLFFAGQYSGLIFATIFAGLGFILLTARRGITIDRRLGTVETWWGLLIPFLRNS
jgi:hypothetical protein